MGWYFAINDMFEWWIWQTWRVKYFDERLQHCAITAFNRFSVKCYKQAPATWTPVKCDCTVIQHSHWLVHFRTECYQNGYLAKRLKESPLSSTGPMVHLSSCLFSLSASATTTRCRCHAATPRRPASCWWGSSTLWCRTWVLCQTVSPSTWSWLTMTMVTRTHTHTQDHHNYFLF